MADEIKKAKEKIKAKRKWKIIFTCLGIGLICLLIFSIIVSILWFTGFISDRACRNFTEESVFYGTFDCENAALEEDTEEKFKIQEGSSGGVTQISELEVIVSKVFEESSSAVVGIGLQEFADDNQIIGTGFL
ncbi:MAG TPA: hypothetical protein ENI13_01915, partial [candidate division CPR3 bacterium]|nr:hypothetical protein [candidate division CPR3 bacterium]